MGCGSSDAGGPDEFEGECGRRRQGGSKHADEDHDDFFEVDEAVGEQTLSIKPWIGQVAEPTNHNPVNSEKPDEKYELEYVYGYRSADSRQNCHFNGDGNAVYMTAALGVILDAGSNQQTFFGGGEVENSSKITASDENGHTNDILCCKLSNDRSCAATG
jgi:microtubule-associated protein-like 6